MMLPGPRQRLYRLLNGAACSALLLLTAAAPGGCSTGQVGADTADLSVPVDLRRSNGNPIIGQVCDDTRKCQDVTAGSPARCAVAQANDAVGFCALPCSSDADCDTVVSGRSVCTLMVNTGRSECVLFCGANKVCPKSWSCIASQGFNICQPPQTLPDMM